MKKKECSTFIKIKIFEICRYNKIYIKNNRKVIFKDINNIKRQLWQHLVIAITTLRWLSQSWNSYHDHQTDIATMRQYSQSCNKYRDYANVIENMRHLSRWCKSYFDNVTAIAIKWYIKFMQQLFRICDIYLDDTTVIATNRQL